MDNIESAYSHHYGELTTYYVYTDETVQVAPMLPLIETAWMLYCK